MSEDDEILRDFLEEGRECLESVELGLVALEAVPHDRELIAQVYRALHKVKGTSSLLGFRELETLTHRGEDVLDALRRGSISMTPPVITALLSLADELRCRLDVVEREGRDVAPADLALLAALAAHARGEDLAGAARPGLIDPIAEIRPTDPLPAAGEADAQAVPPAGASGAESGIRVAASTLDTLMGLAGELVLLRGRLAELTANESGGELVDTYRQLRRATDELLGTVREARLQPIGTITRRYPRVARDLALELGKQVTVTVSGEEVGVDRAINEALADALLHLVRNAVDHGLETPAERAVLGKPPAGTITIDASQEGGRVCVEIRDDGRGIDLGAVAARAVAAGAVSREDLDGLDDAGRRRLIFLPGLSTREDANTISGRGVGMDAVRVNLARVGGTIEVSSALGRGTTFRIDVPLTLAIVPCLLVTAAGRRYCLPQGAIREVAALADRVVDEVAGASLLRGRDGLIPLVDLAGTLAVAGDARTGPDDPAVVIVESEAGRYGLVVGQVGNPIEAVVKPLPLSVRAARIFSGVSVLADGSPTLILDLDAFGAHVGLHGTPLPATPPAAPAAPAASSERVELLLARGRDGRRLAVPAADVRRLQLATPERLRRGSGRELLDEGPTLLPLVRLDDERGTGELDVIVCASPRGEVGLVVDAIDDIVHGEIISAPAPGAPGLARLDGDGGVADLLDLADWTPEATVAT